MVPFKSKKRLIVAGCAVLGLLVSGMALLLYVLSNQHHYSEVETFFTGSVSDRKVIGISYVDYHGFGFMEGIQWKVQLRDHRGDITIYQNRHSFQESIPHQPSIEIKGDQVLIDDGENHLAITVQK